MEKRYQIFVSSTYEDLKEERTKVTETILKMYQLPIGMEMFHADDKEQWSQIQKTIDMSDYYILIIGRCCGTLIENEKISYTEKEYNYALSKNIPILRFVIDAKAKKEDCYPETKKQQAAYDRFKKKVTQNYQCAFWQNPDDLASKVFQALIAKFNEDERDGWVQNTTDNIYNNFLERFEQFSDSQLDELYRRFLKAKLVSKNLVGNSKASLAMGALIEKKLDFFRDSNNKIGFYIKDLERTLKIKLLDEYIEIENSISYRYEGIPDEKEFKYFPWLLPGREEITYRFESVKYNTNETLEYVKRGIFSPTSNGAYEAGGIGVEIPYDTEAEVHEIVFNSNYHTDYARFFHSYTFARYCEKFHLHASLQDMRKKPVDKYILKWEMYTPNSDYSYNSKHKIKQSDMEMNFASVEWMIPGCGYIITINQVKG